MNPGGDKPNFLDRGTLLAIALILIFWFGWAKFMESRNPPQPATQAAAPGAAAPATPETPSSAGATVPSAAQPATANGGASVEEKLIDFENENLAFQLSSKGMGLRDINVKKFRTRADQPIVLGAVKTDLPFSTTLVGTAEPIDFVIERAADGVFVGKADVNGLHIEKTMKLASNGYAFDTEIKVTGQMDAFKGLATSMSEPLEVPDTSGGFLNRSSQYDHQEWFVRHEDTKTRKTIAPKDGVQLDQQNVSIAALSAHYFTMAVVDHSDLMPTFSSHIVANAAVATGRLTYTPVSKAESFTVRYVAYAGPKNFEVLGQIDEHLSQIVDYGMFGFLGKPILWLLKYLFTLIGNWGWSIVLLTIIVRAIVLPFNAYSYKSMKAMQRIQPEMNRIKERYKDKPADQKLQMNQEIMTLMKTNKASPLGGCLPTLLQLPVFFALYQVLGQSIELYRAPFILWIHDLSDKDHFFVLPVLMAVTMFIQQKLTPTTMDPQQAKILQWMPVIFAIFMLSLPSGLTLYIFVSTLFGIVQQYIFMRDRSTVQSRVKEAKA